MIILALFQDIQLIFLLRYVAIKVDVIVLIYWSVRLSFWRGGDEVNGLDGGDRYFGQVRVSLRVYKNLVQHPSNNISNTVVQKELQ